MVILSFKLSVIFVHINIPFEFFPYRLSRRALMSESRRPYSPDSGWVKSGVTGSNYRRPFVPDGKPVSNFLSPYSRSDFNRQGHSLDVLAEVVLRPHKNLKWWP